MYSVGRKEVGLWKGGDICFRSSILWGELGLQRLGKGLSDPGHSVSKGMKGGGEVTAKVKCVLHLCGLIVICQTWVSGRCLFSPEEMVGFIEDTVRQ